MRNSDSIASKLTMAVIMVHSLARANVESLLDEDVAEPETTTPPPPPPGNSPDIRHQIITLSTTAILIQVLGKLARRVFY